LRLRAIGKLVKDWPRAAAALAFGLPSAALVHFSWYPDARMSGITPALSVGAGLAHALAATLTGARLVHSTRGPMLRSAPLLGAMTSLIALALFSAAFTAYLAVNDASQNTPLGYAVLGVYTGFFAFLAAGWSLLILSMGIGWALRRIASFV
jgi:hypothetical protein